MPTASNKQRILQRLMTSTKRAGDSLVGPNAPVLDQLLFSVLLEGTTRERAEQAFRALQTAFFDWNEVRVSMVREVEDALDALPHAEEKAQRIISLLQEIFDTTFSFDLEGLHKKGLKLAEKQLERYQACTPFVVAYVLANALGGHALPIDHDMERALLRLQVLDADGDVAAQRASLEHQVPKAKGPTFVENLSAVAHDCCAEHQPQCGQCTQHEDCPEGLKFLQTGKKAPRERPLAKTKVK